MLLVETESIGGIDEEVPQEAVGGGSDVLASRVGKAGHDPARRHELVAIAGRSAVDAQGVRGEVLFERDLELERRELLDRLDDAVHRSHPLADIVGLAEAFEESHHSVKS